MPSPRRENLRRLILMLSVVAPPQAQRLPLQQDFGTSGWQLSGKATPISARLEASA
jgi:hypothetical protein